MPIVILVATVVLAVQASFVIAAPGARDQAQPNEVPIARLTPAPAEEIAMTQAVEVPPSPATQAPMERESAKREQIRRRALSRDWDVMLKRFQAEMERLQLSGQWQATVAQFEEALAKGQWQATVAQFEEALAKGQWQATVAQFEEAFAKALGQSTDRDQAGAAKNRR